MKNFRRVLAYLRFYKTGVALNVLFNLLSIIFSLASLTMVVPFLDLLFNVTEAQSRDILAAGPPQLTLSVDSMKQSFYYYFTNMVHEHDKLYGLMFLCGMIVIFFFLKNLCRYLALFFANGLLNGIIRDIRRDLYNKSLELPLSWYSQEKKGDLISRLSSDIIELKFSILLSIEVVFREPFAIVITLIMLVVMSPQLTLFVVIMLPVSALVIGRIGRSLRKTSAKSQESMGGLMSSFEETLGGIRIIKAFSTELFFADRFKRLNNEYNRLSVRMDRKRDRSAPLSELMGALALTVVLWFGGKLVLDPGHALSASTLILYVTMFSQVITPAKAFSTAYYNIQKGEACAERIYEVLDAPLSITEEPNAISVNTFERSVEYKNVSFAYRNGEVGFVLNNINLTIEKGKTIALVGQSGSGKSTLADMLPRFYDVTQGGVYIDGKDIRTLKIKGLRDLMGIVTQESILFNDTIFNNIAFGLNDVKEEDVIAAAKIANAHEFIAQMEQGYQTNIGDRGGRLSGGQRQRISIARAVLRDPSILILDEATSALDTESERLVQDALQKLMKNRTSIIIAHRLSTIQHADEIIVMQKGEIIERGTHNELIAQNGAYTRLYELQSFR